MASRALRFLYTTVRNFSVHARDDSDSTSPAAFPLHRAAGLTDLVRALHSRGYRAIEAHLGDVKNVFTELPHHAILDAVDWIFTLCRDEGIDAVHIGPGKRGAVAAGAKSTYRAGHNMTLVQLREIIAFDLDNCMYVVNTLVLKQKKGVPMGSPLSPPLAILICMYYEAEALAGHTAPQGVDVIGTRWVGGLLPLFGSFEDELDCAENWAYFQRAYHEDMDLEEEEHDGAFKFLDAWVTLLPGGGVQSELYNKNKVSLHAEGRQQYYRLPHARSCVSGTVRVATVIGMPHRAHTFSSTTAGLIRSARDLITELRSIEYSTATLSKAFSKIHQTTQDERWIDTRNTFL